ncbi:MAG: hypothetical protein RLY31_2583 [Bacteroidota bacterium]
MKKHILLAIFAICASGATAQSFISCAGLRMGTDWGLSIRQRIAPHLSLEGILQSSLIRKESMVSLLATHHFPVIHKGINLYMGGGLHRGWLDTPATAEKVEDPFGISLIGGAELTLARLNISYDVKPAVHLRGGAQALYLQSGVSVRYVLLNDRDLRQHKRRKERASRKEMRKERLEDWKQQLPFRTAADDKS